MKNLLQKALYLPPVGQRIIKTSVAVFFCLLIYRALGYQGATMPTEAAITAIICMQPFVSDSRTFALNRFMGTIVGTAWGVLFLLCMTTWPKHGQNFIELYAWMAVGVLASVYTAVALTIPDISSLSAIVFMCIVVQFPEIEEPFVEAARRFLGIMIGTSTAIIVNIAHLPRDKNKNCVFFIRAKDLTPNRFSRVPPTILFHLNRLYEDGAKICIMLEHAPAFFTMQMSSCHLSIPLIVMDGAAIYDPDDNRYLSVQHIPPEHSAWLQDYLRSRNINFFTYVIRQNQTCIYHEGQMTELEIAVLKQLQRSPYRSYLDGDNLCPDKIVYLKVLASAEDLKLLYRELEVQLQGRPLRMVIRDQASIPGVSGLYIFAETASLEQAQKRYMDIMQIKYPDLRSVEIFSRTGYRSEHDASVLLHRLRNAYEPVKLVSKLTNKPGKKPT